MISAKIEYEMEILVVLPFHKNLYLQQFATSFKGEYLIMTIKITENDREKNLVEIR